MTHYMKICITSLLVIGCIFSQTCSAETHDLSRQIVEFNHVSITTTDLKPMLHFYQHVLGCQLLPHGGVRSGKALSTGVGIPDAHLLNYKCRMPHSDVLLEFISIKSAIKRNSKLINRTGYTHIGLIVKNLAATYQFLKAKHVKVISAPVEIKQTKAKFFYAYDPDGNIIEFIQQ